MVKTKKNKTDIFESCGFHPLTSQWFDSLYKKPSPPQIHGWPSIAAGQHTLILAPTGSGKTLAAFMWSIDRLLRASLEQNTERFTVNPDGVHTLYISPLKALNNDIQQNLKQPLSGIHHLVSKELPHAPMIRTAVRTGDTPSNIRQSMLKQPPHILITTPESLYLLLTSERGRQLFTNLKYIIVDEIHAISNSKRGVHLSLSLERLENLCQHSPIRIGLSATQKPLERIAAYLGGQKQIGKPGKFSPRPVNIVDCGQRKDIDLRVITPVKKFEDLPEKSVWEPVYKLLYEMIGNHRTTLVFATARDQTERIARNLNEIHQTRSGTEEIIALAHHGSLSRETRFEIETKLKNGKIPAIVATGSLELGIDIGSIDLVVNLQAPNSVSSALQRIGRSGHLISAQSKGRIVALYPSDLDDAVTLSRCVLEGDIEETIIPENVLDVLGQQIVAEVAAREWDYNDLYQLIRQSYCYRNLPESLYENVVELLSGKFDGSALRYLKPRITRDRINNRLIARKGSRLTAVLNGGTIPDRGYFRVQLQDSTLTLGELDEEFVYEARVGETFFLGNSEWRIDDIRQDRIVVTAVAAIKPKAPFWKGDLRYRDFETSQKIGRFRAELTKQLDSSQATAWLDKNFSIDKDTRNNLIDYFNRQLRHSGTIATDKRVVGEWSRDNSGEPIFILHAAFGARVTGLWAIACAAELEKRHKVQCQYSFDDDGFMLRLLDVDQPPPMDELLKLNPQILEELLLEALADTPMFAVHFRYNATRFLLLPRSQPGKRIPLWLQRLRASDLLQTARNFENFPVILETYRDLLYDVFDYKALSAVSEELAGGTMQIELIRTEYPSPMAAGVIFNFIAVAMYEYDQDRRAASGQIASQQLLDEILEKESYQAIISSEMIEKAEARWQHLSFEYQAQNEEDLFEIIEKMGPVSIDELKRRSRDKLHNWITKLQESGRIQHLKVYVDMWFVSTEEKIWLNGSADLQLVEKLNKYLALHGPRTLQQIADDIDAKVGQVESHLKKIKAEKKVIQGQLSIRTNDDQWCDRANFVTLYRKAVGARREVQQPANRSQFLKFLFEWHDITRKQQSIESIMRQYQGYQFPLGFTERELLPNRLPRELSSADRLTDFNDLLARGKFITQVGRSGSEGRKYIRFIARSSGRNYDLIESNIEQSPCSAHAENIMRFLAENGASFVSDLQTALDLGSNQIQDALNELVENGLISCDDYSALRAVINKRETQPSTAKKGLESNIPRTAWGRPSQGIRRPRLPARQSIDERLQLQKGRWFLTDSFAVSGKERTESEQVEFQARLLLQRHGILVKEWYRLEKNLMPWYKIFQVLKKLEWQGEIRRGYFVKGLSGLQFALPEAVDSLDRIVSEAGLQSNSEVIALSTSDPALPFGGAIPWDIFTTDGSAIRITRSAGNHVFFWGTRVVGYSENYASRLTIFDESENIIIQIIERIKDWLRLPTELKPRQKIDIEQINNFGSLEYPKVVLFTQAGFEQEAKQLVLWPSAV